MSAGHLSVRIDDGTRSWKSINATKRKEEVGSRDLPRPEQTLEEEKVYIYKR